MYPEFPSKCTHTTVYTLALYKDINNVSFEVNRPKVMFGPDKSPLKATQGKVTLLTLIAHNYDLILCPPTL